MTTTTNQAPNTRLAAETRYRNIRNLAFEAAEHVLAAAGIGVELRSIDAPAIAAASQWTARRVQWTWPPMAARWRRNYPARFEAAIWRGDMLCGLALGRPAPAAPHLSLYYLEANPDPANPLRGMVTRITLATLIRYADLLGKTELRLIDPLPPLVPFYCSPDFGFRLVTPAKGAPYCVRSI